MADFQVHKLYDVSSDVIQYHQTTQLPIDKNSEQTFMTETGQYITRHITRMNRVITFWFYEHTDNIKTYEKIINTVNDNRVVIGGQTFDKNKVLIKNIQKRKVPVKYQSQGKDGKVYRDSSFFQIFVELQIQIQKPLYKQKLPTMGYYFKDSDGLLKRIQRKSCCSKGSPYGYGFYSQDRHDLDVPYKMFLKGDGGIAFKVQEVHMVQYQIRKQGSWRCLELPTIEGTKHG